MLLSDPLRHTAVIVSASTKDLGLDLPIIAPGELPSLGQRSFVRCDKARLVAASLLDIHPPKSLPRSRLSPRAESASWT